MKKSTWISLVDIVAFVALALLLSTGLVMYLTLPPGSGRIDMDNAGWGAQHRPIALVWGLTRHQWGDLHVYLSVLFLAAIAAHLLIHWRWIKVSFKGMDTKSTRTRASLGMLALAALVALAAAPLLSPKSTITRAELSPDHQAMAMTSCKEQQLDTPGKAHRGRRCRRQRQE